MKKLFLLFLPAILLFAASCSDDDKEDNLKGHPIIGQWVANSYTYDVKTSDDAVTKLLEEYLQAEMPAIEGGMISFNDNGIAISSLNGEYDETKYGIKGSKLILKDDDYDDVTIDYAIKGDILTLTFDFKAVIESMYLYGYATELPSGFKIERAKLIMTMERSKSIAS